jgi:hypothetical protein
MKRALFFLLMIICICNISAQSSSPEIVSSAGETFQGNSMQIDWTLGELAATIIQSSSLQITQGFHQPNYTITSVNELPQEIGEIKVYPNPASERIEMKLNFEKNRNVKIQLINFNGRLIWTTNKNGNQIEQVTEIADLPNGNYFLNFLIDGNKYSQTFKIQKLN